MDSARRSGPCSRTVAAALLLAGAAAARAAGPPAPPEAPRPASPSPGDRTDAIFARWDGDETPGCAVVVVRAGQIVYRAGFGRAHLEHDLPITPETVFHIASVSKQFVAFAVCLLASDAALGLDDDVRAHVPEVPDFGTPITLRHLVHHVSGLRDQWDLLTLAGWRMDDVITREDVMELVTAQRELNFEPGRESLYSNTGYTLLGLVVERVSGQSLDGFCQARLFGPLGMSRTHFQEDHRRLVPGRAECYMERSVAAPPHTRSGADRPARSRFEKSVLSYAVAGATSLFTTVEDLARWEDNFATGLVGGPETLSLMEQRYKLPSGERLAYGMGLVHGEHLGRPTRSHGGADAGFRSMLLRFPESRLSVAILANAPMPVGALAHQVASVWLERAEATHEHDPHEPGPAAVAAAPPEAPARSPPPVTLDRARLDALAGRYVSSEPPIAVELRAVEGGLEAKVGDRGPLRLVPESPARFRLEGIAAGTVEFDEADGQVRGLRVAMASGNRFVLERAAPDAGSGADLAAYAGRYESPELSVVYEIVHDPGTDPQTTGESGQLMLRRRKHGTVPLLELGTDHFGGPFRIRFERGDDGTVSGFRVTTGRIRALWFERR